MGCYGKSTARAEFFAPSTLLTYINYNADVWVGWTAWNLDPDAISVTDTVTGLIGDTPKMTWYAPYF